MGLTVEQREQLKRVSSLAPRTRKEAGMRGPVEPKHLTPAGRFWLGYVMLAAAVIFALVML